MFCTFQLFNVLGGSGLGPMEAAKRKGIIVTGINASKDGLQAAGEGRMTLVIAQKQKLMGRLGLSMP